MKRLIQISFYTCTLVCLVGVLVGFIGISQMKQHKVPPFNEGLYTAIWTMRPPPAEIVAWCDSRSGSVAIIAGLLAIPALFGTALFRLNWRVVGLGGMAAISLAVAWIGFWIWTWARYQLG